MATRVRANHSSFISTNTGTEELKVSQAVNPAWKL